MKSSSTFPARQQSSRPYLVQTLGLAVALVLVALSVSYVLLGVLGVVAGALILVLTLTFRNRGEQLWRLRGAREVVPNAWSPSARWLYQAVAELARRAEIPMPKVYLLAGAAPNAVATETFDGRGAVALTQGIVSLLSPREVIAVIAHELSHLRHGDLRLKRLTAVASNTAVTLLRISVWLGFFLAFASGEWAQWFLLFLLNLTLPSLLLSLDARLSRTREFAADEGAVRLTKDAPALASALTKLEHVSSPLTRWLNPMRPLLDEFSSHPATAERVRRLLALSPPPEHEHLVPHAPMRTVPWSLGSEPGHLLVGVDTAWHSLAPVWMRWRGSL